MVVLVVVVVVAMIVEAVVVEAAVVALGVFTVFSSMSALPMSAPAFFEDVPDSRWPYLLC